MGDSPRGSHISAASSWIHVARPTADGKGESVGWEKVRQALPSESPDRSNEPEVAAIVEQLSDIQLSTHPEDPEDPGAPPAAPPADFSHDPPVFFTISTPPAAPSTPRVAAQGTPPAAQSGGSEHHASSGFGVSEHASGGSEPTSSEAPAAQSTPAQSTPEAAATEQTGSEHTSSEHTGSGSHRANRLRAHQLLRANAWVARSSRRARLRRLRAHLQ